MIARREAEASQPDPEAQRRREAQRRAEERYEAMLIKQAPSALGPRVASGAGGLGSQKPSPEPRKESPSVAGKVSCGGSPADFYVDPGERFNVRPAADGVGYQLETWDKLSGGLPDEVLPGFLWLAGERESLQAHQFVGHFGFREFTHVLFATNVDRSPYKARFYHRIMLNDDPGEDLKAQRHSVWAFAWHWSALTPCALPAGLL